MEVWAKAIDQSERAMHERIGVIFWKVRQAVPRVVMYEEDDKFVFVSSTGVSSVLKDELQHFTEVEMELSAAVVVDRMKEPMPFADWKQRHIEFWGLNGE